MKLPMFKGLNGVWLAGATSDFLSILITIAVFRKFSIELEKKKTNVDAVVEA